MASRLLLAAVCIALSHVAPAAGGDSSVGFSRGRPVNAEEEVNHGIRAYSLARQLELQASVVGEVSAKKELDQVGPQVLRIELRGSYANTKLWLREMLARHDDLALVSLRMSRASGDPLGPIVTQATLGRVPRPATGKTGHRSE